MNSPIKYFGGKGNGLGKKLIDEFFPENHNELNYLEPFGGSAAILFRKEVSPIEIYNDLEENVYSLFKVLSDVELFSEFKHKCDLTPYSKKVVDEFKVELRKTDLSIMDRAYMYFIVNRQSFNGVGGFSASSHIRRKMSKSVSDYLSTVDRLEEVHQRLSKVIIHNTDAIKLIDKYKDNDDWFMYLDPPYHHSTRTSARYKVDMNNEQQEEFLDKVIECKCKVIISGYDCIEYDRLVDNGWTKISFDVKTQNSNQEGKVKTETLWFNYTKTEPLK